MTQLPLELFFYCVIILSMILYAVLDGFDLGVGVLHLFVKKDEERRLFLNAIGPVWDGNEVWLVIVGGGLFAGFPNVYATLFSSFYDMTIFFLFALIFRAVSIEFRSKHHSPSWRSKWDIAFCLASLLISFGVGVVLGNLIQGIPLNENQDFVGNPLHFFNLYSILVGITTIALFSMHGSIYLTMKLEGKLHMRLRSWVNRCILFFLLCYVATTGATWLYQPHMLHAMQQNPWLFVIPLFGFLSILNVPRLIHKKRDGLAFIFSAMSISLLLCLFAIGTFPTLIRSSLSPESNSLTLYNSASSTLTLKVLMIIVITGVPLILAYGTYIYRVFRGKVKLDSHSY